MFLSIATVTKNMNPGNTLEPVLDYLLFPVDANNANRGKNNNIRTL